MNESLKMGIESHEGKLRTIINELSIEENAARMNGANSQSYGAKFEIYIRILCGLFLSPPKNNSGDSYFYAKCKRFSLVLNKYVIERFIRYVEHKISYPDTKTNSTYSILRLKPTQLIHYYIIILVDPIIAAGARLPHDFKVYCYCLHATFIEHSADIKKNTVNGTIEANKNNENNETRFTIKKEDAFKLFGEHNMAGGTSIGELVDCMRMLANDQPVADNIETKPMQVKSTSKMTAKEITNIFQVNPVRRGMSKKFAIEINGEIIRGRSNQETALKFVDHIGILKAKDIFTPSYLSKTPNKWRTMQVGNSGYYLSQIISNRDMKDLIRRGVKKRYLNVRVIDVD